MSGNDMDFPQTHLQNFQSKVNFTFRSKAKYISKEFQVTWYKFQKMTFLMSPTKPRYNLEQVLRQSNTAVVPISFSPSLIVEFVSDYHEHDFPDWVENCLNLTEHCVRDLELLLIKGAASEINHIEREGVLSNIVGDNSVWVFRMYNIDGIFLVGSVDCVIYLIPELQKPFQNISFWNPGTGEEVIQNVLNISTMYYRLNAIFQGTEKLVTSFPHLRIRYIGSEAMLALGMLGSQRDISAGIDFFNSLVWLGGVPWRYCPWFEGFEFFLARQQVRVFIDRMITTQDGTWVIDNHSKLVVFGKTEEDINAVLSILNGAIRKIEFFVADSRAFPENANEWATQSTELGNKYDGKCYFSINTIKSSNFLQVTFMFTVDLENEQPLKKLIHNVELQSFKKVSLPRSEKQLTWIQFFYSGDLTTEAQRAGVYLNIRKDINAIELEGTFTAVREVTGFIDSICMEEHHILLPLEVLPVKPMDFFREYRCCFEYAKSENTKLWIRGNIGIVASLCQSGFDHMYAHVKAKLVQGERRDQDIKWVDESSVLVKCPILETGDKGNVLLLDGSLKLLIRGVKETKKMSVAFDTQDLSPQQIHALLKSILDQVPDLPDGLIIVLYLLDGASFQTVVEYLQTTETYLTYGGVNGLQRKTIDLQVMKGRIAELPFEVDVIINTTSPDLDLTKGAVCNSILQAAGDSLKTKLDNFPVISGSGHLIRVKYGEIVETDGYLLKCRRIFHGPLYKWTGDGKRSSDVLRRFVKNCLSLADDRKFKTLAFPAIGTGRLQIPPDVVASCVKEVVGEFSVSHPHTSVEKLIFVIHEADTANFQVFKTILEKKTELAISPILYNLTIYGKRNNIDAAMESVTALFQKHIITTSEATLAVNETKDAAKTAHQQENTSAEVYPAEPTKIKGNSPENISKVPTPSVLSAKEDQLAPDTDDEKCLRLQSKNGITLSEKTLGPILKDAVCDCIVCPFLEERGALIIFKTTKDADKFLSNFANENFAVQKLPKQAVKDTTAKLSPKVISVLETRKISSREFYRRTGGTLCIQTWTVSGNLLILQHVQKFLTDLVEEFEKSKGPETWNAGDSLWWM